MLDASGKTAIHRKKMSQPMAWLEKQHMLACNRPNRRLDYGCGHGKDADLLGMQKYDPNWFDCDKLPNGHFDIVTCIYVLNVIQDEHERNAVCQRLIELLADCGTAYIAVRNDAAALNGFTSKGTWQGLVSPPRHPWGGPIRTVSDYRIFSYTKL